MPLISLISSRLGQVTAPTDTTCRERLTDGAQPSTAVVSRWTKRSEPKQKTATMKATGCTRLLKAWSATGMNTWSGSFVDLHCNSSVLVHRKSDVELWWIMFDVRSLSSNCALLTRFQRPDDWSSRSWNLFHLQKNEETPTCNLKPTGGYLKVSVLSSSNGSTEHSEGQGNIRIRVIISSFFSCIFCAACILRTSQFACHKLYPN